MSEKTFLIEVEAEIPNGGRHKTMLRLALIIGAVLVSTLAFSFSSWIGATPDFDVIIVGAGPAGSAAAYHLGGAGVSVLVLEAGGLSQYATGGRRDFLFGNLTVFDVPLAWSYVAHLRAIHWNFKGDVIIAKAVGGCGVSYSK
mmetsp:Transcript_74132/g.149374  ORF Transcript_74132/g.149374 Transcript_74132/m.149374 type:complete len:143 (-) Transcript_74132:1955-2383(-)